MIYAINKRTKEHRIYRHPNDAGFWADCELVQADADGWIPWEGGECPLPDGMSCEVKHRDGEVLSRDKVEKGYESAWMRMNLQSDIIAYRPIPDVEPSEPEAPEWDGESWPPPIGAIVESTARDKDGHTCEVLAVRQGVVIGCHVGTAVAGWLVRSETRPLRTPAQRAEEAIRRGIVESLSVAAEEGRDVLDDDVCASVIASAIRDGKIPGVKLEEE